MLQKSAAEENTVLTSHASKIVVSGPVQQCKACVVFCASPIALAGCAPALDANRCTHDAGTQVTWRSIKHSACVNFSVKYPREGVRLTDIAVIVGWRCPTLLGTLRRSRRTATSWTHGWTPGIFCRVVIDGWRERLDGEFYS